MAGQSLDIDPALEFIDACTHFSPDDPPLSTAPSSLPHTAYGDTGSPPFMARNVAGNLGLLIIQVQQLASSLFNKSEQNRSCLSTWHHARHSASTSVA